MAEYKHILFRKRGTTARVILNRPRYRNAQSHLLLDEMDDAFQVAAADDDIRVIVLSGEGMYSGGNGKAELPAQGA